MKGLSIAFACCGVVFIPGSLVFGFPGVLGKHWMEAFGVGGAEIGQILFFVLAGAGIFMYQTGKLQEKTGPFWLTAFGSLLCGASVILVGYASSIRGVHLWAFLTGASSAFVYLPSLTVLQLWFPKRRGLVSGLVNMAFALSAAMMAPIYTGLLQAHGYRYLTCISGVLVLIIGLGCSALIRFPGPEPTAAAGEGAGTKPTVSSLTVTQSLRTKAFWLLWFTWAFAGAAGIAMVNLSTSFGMSKGLTLQQAVLILTAFNLTNGLSRLFSGFTSDLIGRRTTMSLAFVAAGIAYLLMNHLQGLMLWSILAAGIGVALGTLFAVSAPLVANCFGLRHFGAIFGLIFTAYGFVSGALGPWLSGYLLDITGGNFTLVLTYLGMFLLASALLIKFVTPPQRRFE